MSKKSLTQKAPPKQSQPPEPQLDQGPTEMELAERCVLFVDYSFSQSDNLTHVLVAVEKTAHALRLAIGGLRNENEHDGVLDEDFSLLGEMAWALSLFCDQAKKLTAKAQPAAAPARAA